MNLHKLTKAHKMKTKTATINVNLAFPHFHYGISFIPRGILEQSNTRRRRKEKKYENTVFPMLTYY